MKDTIEVNRHFIVALTICLVGVFLILRYAKPQEIKTVEAEKVVIRTIYRTKTEYIIKEIAPILVQVALPEQKTKFISYLPYDKITRQGSKQLAYVTLGKADEQGLYKFDDKFMVAMGKYYGELGTCFKVTLSNGKEIEIIMTERKANEDTDSNNQFCIHNGSVLEFIVDKKILPKEIAENSQIEKLIGGFPMKIERIEKNDTTTCRKILLSKRVCQKIRNHKTNCLQRLETR